MVKKAVAYLRVSTEEQVERYGFDRQLDAINRYAQENGIEIVEVFRDEGVSGATDPLSERIGFGIMLNYLDAHQDVNCIIISELGRLAREVRIQENMIFYLQKRGLELISASEPDLYSSDPSRVAMRQFYGVMNQYERAMIAIRMKAGRIQKARSGEHAGGRVPTGFKTVVNGKKRTLEKNEEEIEIVRLIFELREKGFSYQYIADYLNEKGYKPKYAQKFGYSTVRKIYLNPKYRGIVKYKEGGHTIQVENDKYRIV